MGLSFHSDIYNKRFLFGVYNFNTLPFFRKPTPQCNNQKKNDPVYHVKCNIFISGHKWKFQGSSFAEVEGAHAVHKINVSWAQFPDSSFYVG